MQFSSLWDISYEYVRFFSIAQLIQDMIVILPIFMAVLLAIYFYYMIGVIDNIYQFFRWLNSQNEMHLNKKYLGKELLKYILYFLISVTFFYEGIFLYFKKYDIYEIIIFFIALLMFFTFSMVSATRTLSLFKILVTSRKIEFDKKLLDENFYLKFGTTQYWLDSLNKQYLKKYGNIKEIDFVKPDIMLKLFVLLIITYFVVLINGLLLEIDRNMYKNISFKNINIIKMEEKIVSDYKLNEKPIFLYMNSNYIFYDINTQNRINRKKENQIILIVKKENLFE